MKKALIVEGMIKRRSKDHLRIRYIFLFFLVAYATDGFAQFAVTKSVIDRENNRLEKEVLDQTVIRSLYRYEQVANNEGAPVTMVDSMMLEIGESYSYYYDFLQHAHDSVYTAKMGHANEVKSIDVVKDQETFNSLAVAGGGEIIAQPEKRNSTKLYKQRKVHEITMIDEFQMKVYKCTEKIAPQAWTIMPDTLTILGYLCQKATCHFRGRNYVAWYSLEIPINEGPWKFYGLPGLILHIEDEEGLFTFSAIGIERLTTPTSITMDKDHYVSCSNNELIQLVKNKLKNRSMVYRRGGAFSFLTRTNPIKYHTLEVDL